MTLFRSSPQDETALEELRTTGISSAKFGTPLEVEGYTFPRFTLDGLGKDLELIRTKTGWWVKTTFDPWIDMNNLPHWLSQLKVSRDTTVGFFAETFEGLQSLIGTITGSSANQLAPVPIRHNEENPWQQ